MPDILAEGRQPLARNEVLVRKDQSEHRRCHQACFGSDEIRRSVRDDRGSQHRRVEKMVGNPMVVNCPHGERGNDGARNSTGAER